MILKAAWVVPVTAPPIRRGYVKIAGARLVGVGAVDEGDLPAEGVVDVGNAVLVPGLVNPHTHLELGCYAGQLAPGPFWDWLKRLVRLRRRRGREQRERQAVSEGAWRSLRAGVTCVGDVSRENVAWQALKDVPIRKVCFVELIHQAEQSPRDVAELDVAVAAVEEDDLLTAGISPHAPYTVPAEQIRGALALARERSRPWMMHWAETPEEVAFLRGQPGRLPPFAQAVVRQCRVAPPGLAPLEYLRRCAADCDPGALAHVNYIGDGEIAGLAAAGHTVVYCPRAHRFFGHAAHPFPRLRRAGVRVALGTDSLASTESLSVLDEAHHVYARVPDPPSAETLLRMVTLEAARGLGLAGRIGSLEAGKRADLAAFPCASGVADPVEALIRRPLPPSAVWVAGRQVV